MGIEIVGASPGDAGPKGVVAGFLVAVAARDEERAKAFLTEESRRGFSAKNAPVGDGAARIGEPQTEADATLVPTVLEAPEGTQEMPFVLVEVDGAPRIDLDRTMTRLLGFSPEEMMREMGGALAAGMEAVGEGIAEAMDGGARALGGEPTPEDDEREPEQEV